MQPVKTPVEPGMIQRAIAGIRYAFTGNAPEWFGPGEPLQPVAQESAQGRQFDFPVAVNTVYTPRKTEAITFGMMRALADSYDLMRVIIETRKDQICKFKWSIKTKEGNYDGLPGDKKQDAKALQPAIEQVTRFLRYPDQEHDWQTWLRMLIEEMLVIDAATIMPRRTLNGGLYSLELIDGATINRVLDATGRTPMAPDPAYQQILKGMPAVNYTSDELLYCPRNPRTNRIYGYSPVEQVIMTVNIALRRQAHQMYFYSEGTIPDMIVGMPPEWNPDQIAQYQQYWDTLLTGNMSARRGARFVPGGLNITETKDEVLKDEYDEWLARLVCFAFSVEPTPFIKQQNRATAETARSQSLSEGLVPIQQWVAGIINRVIEKYMGISGVEFAWNEDDIVDPLVRAQVYQIYAGAKIMHPDEIRETLGMEPLTKEQYDQLNPQPVVTAQPGGSQKPGNNDTAKKPDEKLKKNSIAPIDRDRKEIINLQERIKVIIQEALSKQRAIVLAMIVPELGKAADGGTPKKVLRDIEKMNMDELQAIREEMETLLSIVAVSGGGEALKQISVLDDDVRELMSVRATDWARGHAAEMVGMKMMDGELVPNPDTKWNIEDSTREMVRETVTKAIDDGWSNQRLAKEIQDGDAFSDARAMMIARTETAMADVAGTMEGYRASGLVTGKKWLTAQDDKVSAQCMACEDAGEIGIDETFPGGNDAPPNHPNCRCAILPVLN